MQFLDYVINKSAKIAFLYIWRCKYGEIERCHNAFHLSETASYLKFLVLIKIRVCKENKEIQIAGCGGRMGKVILICGKICSGKSVSKKAVEIVQAGANVILDWGFWIKQECLV
jgi:hypothetical protein